jgi:hypothetical protein
MTMKGGTSLRADAVRSRLPALISIDGSSRLRRAIAAFRGLPRPCHALSARIFDVAQPDLWRDLG